ncbi:hypothetical protein LIER_22403 [Lithospermum erythrorhizon]|uniref:Uncharacterized protein n=1 Tax=Lithospermum erythrorhizon TaxID=34254 RepID=A0AAV3QWZ2_LITER
MLTRGVLQAFDLTFELLNLLGGARSFSYNSIPIPAQLSHLKIKVGALRLELIQMRGCVLMPLVKPQIVLHQLLLLSLEADIDSMAPRKLRLNLRKLLLQESYFLRRSLSLEVLILLPKTTISPRQLEGSTGNLKTKEEKRGIEEKEQNLYIPGSHAYTCLRRPPKGQGVRISIAQTLQEQGSHSVNGEEIALERGGAQRAQKWPWPTSPFLEKSPHQKVSFQRQKRRKAREVSPCLGEMREDSARPRWAKSEESGSLLELREGAAPQGRGKEATFFTTFTFLKVIGLLPHMLSRGIGLGRLSTSPRAKFHLRKK